MLLMLLALPILAAPAGARAWVECEDGSSCDGMVVKIAAPLCCEPAQAPADHRCVVRTRPAVDCDVPAAAPAVPELLPLALFVPPPVDQLVPLHASRAGVEDERPPTLPDPKQGHAARAPPAC